MQSSLAMELQTPPPPLPVTTAMDSVVGLLASPENDVGSQFSSPLAIHVYSKLAKLHKHSLIPYLPRIMASVLSSLSCSPQLHPACAQVVAALATHTIDSSCDPAFNEDTLRNLCLPLLSALSSSHPSHLAAGVASCLQTLVESNRWRCAPLDLQELVCMKGTDALMEEGTQTVAHMDLMGSLAKSSSSVVIQGYGAPLLKAGMDILHNSCDSEKRVAAAQLLEGVLKIVDADLLDLDLSPIVGVLQECQQDRVVGVRSAAADALRTASMHVTSEITSQRIQGLLCHPNLQQKSLGLQQTMCCVTSPDVGYEDLPNVALPDGKTPCHVGFEGRPNLAFPNGKTPCSGTAFTFTPSSSKSNKWLKRLPLAPLQQSLLENSPLVAASRRRPAAFQQSEYKENIAPTNKARLVVSNRDKGRRTWTSTKRDSPMLWPKNSMRKDHSESLNVFESPQTPIVSFRGGAEAEDGNSSVGFLLEKHFGKQRDCFEDQIHTYLSKSNANMTCFTDEVGNQREDRYDSDNDEISNSLREDVGRQKRFGEGDVCTSLDSDMGEKRSINSTRTDTCCGTEMLYSPSQESVGECESGTTSEVDCDFRVTKKLTLDEDMLMTPKRLICSLLSDDDYQPHSNEEQSVADSEAGSCLYGLDELEGDDYDVDLNTDLVLEESIASSPCTLPETYNLHCEWDAQMSVTKERSSMRRGIKCNKLSDVLGAGGSRTSTLTHPRLPCLGSARTKQYHNQDCQGQALASCDDDRANGAGGPLEIAGCQRINVECRAVKSTEEKMGFVSCSKLWQKARVFLLLVIAIGVFCMGIMVYMVNMEASNMLVPT